MNAPTPTHAKARYPTTAKIASLVPTMVKVARELGLDVAGVEVSPDGSIRVFEARATVSEPGTDFDRFKDEL